MERLKGFESFVEQILNLVESEIKQILWILCYDPQRVFEEYEIAGITPEKLQEEILNACRQKDENFIFASEEPRINSFGIDLKIKNPVIRDTVIEHCVNASEDSAYLRWCISKICTRRDDFEYFEKRREAFDLLEFSEEEQAFLESAMDTYCIGELLKAIQRDKYPTAAVYKKKNTHTARFVERPKHIKSEENNNISDSKLDSTKLLENEELVKTFIIFFTKLEDVGLDPRKLVNKQEAIDRFYKSAAGLA